RIFGVKTEIEDEKKILQIKRIAKPAYKCISEWKDLRIFRNEAIAHNHRKKDGRNIYLNYQPYNSPRTSAEVYLLCFCIKKMMDVVYFFFGDAIEKIK